MFYTINWNNEGRLCFVQLIGIMKADCALYNLTLIKMNYFLMYHMLDILKKTF